MWCMCYARPYEHRMWCIYSDSAGVERRHSMDCAEARRLLAHIRRHRRNQSASDLAQAATALDFVINKTLSKDSYWWAVKPGRRFSIPTAKNPVPVGTVTSILRELEAELERICGASSDGK